MNASIVGHQVGQYIIDAQIGEGGMGAVYRAHHAMLGREAAIKILLPQYTSDPAVVQRFFNEAKAATSIKHLGIVEVYDYGLMQDGVAYIAMELLVGESLAQRMRTMRIAPTVSLGIIRQMCNALGVAHSRGIVHRDLKPDNVFLVRDEEVVGGERIKLLDFGIAKLQVDNSSQSKTRTGTLIGTPTYMSPEQCRGVAVDHRADIYALGCMLFEMLAGRPPFVGEGVGDVLGAHIYAQPPALDALVPNLAPGVAQLVAHLLQKDPAARPQAASDVVAAIDRIAGNLNPTPAPGSHPGASATAPAYNLSAPTTLSSVAGSSTQHPAKRRTGLVLGVLGGVVAIGATVAIVASRGDEHPSEAAVSDPVAKVVQDAAAQRTAPTDAAAVAVVDAAPATISISVDSVPPGGHVLLDGKELGETPLKTELPRVDHDLAFTVRHAGFKDASFALPGGEGGSRSVTLDKDRHSGATATGVPKTGSATTPPKSKPPDKKLGGDDSVNPFAK